AHRPAMRPSPGHGGFRTTQNESSRVTSLPAQFDAQHFGNDYQLVDGVAMHTQNPANFHIPPDVIKRKLRAGQFVELRIDSPRFSVHENAPFKCSCPSCSGEMTKPILRHDHPVSLVPLPPQTVPSRGWGEDFWVQIAARVGDIFSGRVDNPLVEARLHGLRLSDTVFFQSRHILAVHDIHRQELVAAMNVDDLKELAQWIKQLRQDEPEQGGAR
ncbi:MAG: hypothetical protein KDA85_22615, partial [Planctomycetaceae bacterium]|nr:hypothetical protein [Planctomycetaceae bacterium]